MASAADAPIPTDPSPARPTGAQLPPQVPKPRRYGVPSLIIAALFGLLYAYSVWQAIGNMVNLPAFYDALGVGSKNVPWWLLWIGVAIPIAGYLIAFAAGRRRNVGAKAVIFILGLALGASLGIGVLAVEDVLRPVVIVAPR